MDGWTAVGAAGSLAAAGVAAWAAYGSRSAAREANLAAHTLARIEQDRRHAELCPQFRVSIRPLGPGVREGLLKLRVLLAGPPALVQLDQLTVKIRDDNHTRGEGQQTAGGPSGDQIKRHVWAPYRFIPGTGPDDARADETGRETVYQRELPVGEALMYQLELNQPPPWSSGTTQTEWLQQQGTVMRLAFLARNAKFGSWRLVGEIDLGSADPQAETKVP